MNLFIDIDNIYGVEISNPTPHHVRNGVQAVTISWMLAFHTWFLCLNGNATILPFVDDVYALCDILLTTICALLACGSLFLVQATEILDKVPYQYDMRI